MRARKPTPRADRLWPLLFFLLTCGTTGPALAADETLGFQGTHILAYETMTRLAEAFRQQEGVKVAVSGGGCSDGVVAVLKGRAELGGLCCPLKAEEKKLGLTPHPVARDIKVAIVNFINPVAGLSTRQLRDIYQGKIKNWKELSWIDRPIAVVFRKHCPYRTEPTREFLGLDAGLGNLAAKAIKVNTDMQVIDYVKRFPTAIGITSAVFVKDRGKDVTSLQLDKVAPSAASVEAGRYRFSSMLYLLTGASPDPATRKFLEFTRSEAGRRIIRENLAAAP